MERVGLPLSPDEYIDYMNITSPGLMHICEALPGCTQLSMSPGAQSPVRRPERLLSGHRSEVAPLAQSSPGPPPSLQHAAHPLQHYFNADYDCHKSVVLFNSSLPDNDSLTLRDPSQDPQRSPTLLLSSTTFLSPSDSISQTPTPLLSHASPLPSPQETAFVDIPLDRPEPAHVAQHNHLAASASRISAAVKETVGLAIQHRSSTAEVARKVEEQGRRQKGRFRNWLDWVVEEAMAEDPRYMVPPSSTAAIRKDSWYGKVMGNGGQV
jgi:hypothetical protein